MEHPFHHDDVLLRIASGQQPQTAPAPSSIFHELVIVANPTYDCAYITSLV
jgi:hypothetical protein